VRSAGCGSSPDHDMPGGEALARSFARQAVLADEFGVETRGVAARLVRLHRALPQLVALSGSRWFLTQEDLVEPDEQVPAPHLLLGGAGRHSHLQPLPARRTRTIQVAGSTRARSRNFADKGGATGSIVPFGLRRRRRGRPARCWPGGPAARLTATARRHRRPASSSLEPRGVSSARYGSASCTEFHRGTYTSQAKTSRATVAASTCCARRAVSATAAVRHGTDYPYEALDRI